MLNSYKRGSVYWYDFGFNEGSVQSGKRPCIIISNDKGNLFSPTVNVIPLTTSKDNLPMHKHLFICGKDNYTCVEQITTVMKTDLYSFVGILEDEDMKLVDEAMKLQFALDINTDDLLSEQLNAVTELLEQIKTIKAEELSNKINTSKTLNASVERLASEVKDLKVGTGNRKYAGMSAIEKFNAKYNQEEKPKKTKRVKWTKELKEQLLSDARFMSWENIVAKYNFKDKKTAQTYINMFKRQSK